MADEVYRFSLEGDEIEDVLEDIYEHNSEAWAVGERKGVPVNNIDPTFQNNSKYWASFAADAVEGASIITDPNEDGNLVIEPPSGSESGWAVRYDTAQTLSEGQKVQARKNIAAGGSNPNLLDNPWFTVNQRGKTSGTSFDDYVADRWRPSYGTGGVSWSRTDDVVTVWSTTGSSQAYLFQNLEPSLSAWLANRTVTLSIMRGDYTIMAASFVWPSSGNRSAIIGDDADGNTIAFLANADTKRINVYKNYTAFNVRAIKLELGSVSTLANDAPTNYLEELAKCQRYFRRVSLTTQTDPFAVGIAYSGDLRLLLPIGKMRATPTITVTNVSAITIRGEGVSGATVTGLTVITQNELGVYLKATTSTSLTSYQLYAMTMTSDSAIIDLSADLL